MADELHISGVYNSFSIDSSLPMSCFGLSSPTMDWNQSFFPGASSGRDLNSLHAVAPEDLSSKPYFQQEEPTGSNQALLQGDFVNQMNQGVLWDGQRLISGEEPGDSISPSTFLGGLLEPADLTTTQLSTYDRWQALSCRTSVMESYNRLSSEEVSPIQWSEFQQHNVPLSSASTEAWMQTSSPSTCISAAQFHSQESEKRSGATTIKAKPKLEGGRNSSSSVKKTSNEPVAKKPRIEMPSPLPTFNVRKEKLQDRVTALQQLVSPFGKTDTASVLYEAIEYIKFLHNQVNALSTPYLRSGHLMQHQQNPSEHNLKDGEGSKQDLRSRGLCLVPISNTIPVAIEPCAELWIPPLCNPHNR